MHRIRMQPRATGTGLLPSCLIALVLNLATLQAADPLPPGMARIPGGIYRPLFRADTGLKGIPVKAFLLDILPVTRGDYLDFVRANPGWRRSQVKRAFADEGYLRDWAGDLELGTNAPANAPVTYVSWFAAKAYAQWKGNRLPTINEWEFAASASPTLPDGENDAAFQNDILRWYTTPSTTTLSTVGQGRANVWGVHDLHGLVWEWVLDFSTVSIAGDARAGGQREPFCGGGSLGATDPGNYPAFMRHAFRSSLKADYCVKNLGFRCARSF